MAYEFENDEWRSAVRQMTELERVASETEHRHSLGLCGDREDARYER